MGSAIGALGALPPPAHFGVSAREYIFGRQRNLVDSDGIRRRLKKGKSSVSADCFRWFRIWNICDRQPPPGPDHLV